VASTWTQGLSEQNPIERSFETCIFAERLKRATFKGCGFVTSVTFLRCCYILGLPKKTKKNTYRVTKTQKYHKIDQMWHCGNVTNRHKISQFFEIPGTKLRLHFTFGFCSERLSAYANTDSNWRCFWHWMLPSTCFLSNNGLKAPTGSSLILICHFSSVG